MTTLKNYKIAVIGGGSFGTALAHVVASNHFETHLWMRDQQRACEAQPGPESKHNWPGNSVGP